MNKPMVPKRVKAFEKLLKNSDTFKELYDELGDLLLEKDSKYKIPIIQLAYEIFIQTDEEGTLRCYRERIGRWLCKQ